MTTTTEVEVYKVPNAPVPVLLTKAEAKALNKKIISASSKLTGDVNKVAVDTKALVALIDQAQTGQIHKALEYTSWTAWFKDTVRIEPANRTERKMLVRLMDGAGLPQRPIGIALGVSQKTVDRDLNGVESQDSTVVTATGKKYPKHPKPKEPVEEPPLDVESEEIPPDEDAPAEEVEPEPSVSTPATVAKDFGSEMDNLGIDTQALCDVVADDCWSKARAKVAKAHLEPLQGIIATLNEIAEDLMSVVK